MLIKGGYRGRRTAPRSAAPPRQDSYNRQRNEALIRHGLRYIPLTCGHYGDRNEDEIYRVIRPSRNHHWCTTCTSWNLVKRAPRRIQSDEPLF